MTTSQFLYGTNSVGSAYRQAQANNARVQEASQTKQSEEDQLLKEIEDKEVFLIKNLSGFSALEHRFQLNKLKGSEEYCDEVKLYIAFVNEQYEKVKLEKDTQEAKGISTKVVSTTFFQTAREAAEERSNGLSIEQKIRFIKRHEPTFNGDWLELAYYQEISKEKSRKMMRGVYQFPTGEAVRREQQEERAAFPAWKENYVNCKYEQVKAALGASSTKESDQELPLLVSQEPAKGSEQIQPASARELYPYEKIGYVVEKDPSLDRFLVKQAFMEEYDKQKGVIERMQGFIKQGQPERINANDEIKKTFNSYYNSLVEMKYKQLTTGQDVDFQEGESDIIIPDMKKCIAETLGRTMKVDPAQREKERCVVS